MLFWYVMKITTLELHLARVHCYKYQCPRQEDIRKWKISMTIIDDYVNHGLSWNPQGKYSGSMAVWFGYVRELVYFSFCVDLVIQFPWLTLACIQCYCWVWQGLSLFQTRILCILIPSSNSVLEIGSGFHQNFIYHRDKSICTFILKSGINLNSGLNTVIRISNMA